MTRGEFVAQLKKNSENANALIEKKNQDYAQETNPFKNFEFSQLLGLSVEKAILMRVVDKIARISNLIDKESEGIMTSAVEDETTEDTLVDIINYINIMTVYRQNKKKRA